MQQKPSYLIFKEAFQPLAQRIFANTNIVIKCQGEWHLGAALGTNSFIEEYVLIKVHEWEKNSCPYLRLQNLILRKPCLPILMVSQVDRLICLRQFLTLLISSNHYIEKIIQNHFILTLTDWYTFL